MVLDDLRAWGALVDTFACVHSSFLDEQILRDLRPKAWHFETNPLAMQGQQVRGARLRSGVARNPTRQQPPTLSQIQRGLELVANAGTHYDLIVVLRLDLVLKQPVSTWPVDPSRLNVPFRSVNDAPNYCTCLVADTVS